MIRPLLKNTILFSLFFFLCLQVPNDPDFGIHLGVGRFILTHKTFPKTDIFSFTMPNNPYTYFSWLGQLIFTVVFDGFSFLGGSQIWGLWALSLIWTAICAGAVYLLYKLCDKSFYLLLIFLSACSLMFSSIGVRPQMFTFIFAVFELNLLSKFQAYLNSEKSSRKKDLIFFLSFFSLFLFWANLHLGFVIGILMLAAYFSVHSFIYLKGDKKTQQSKIFFQVKILILTFLATFINPYGIALYKQAWLISQNPILLRFNLEWQPFVQKGMLHFILAGLIIILLFIIVSRKDSDKRLLILSILLFWLSLRSVRTFLVFPVVFLPLISRMLKRASSIQKIVFPFSWDKLPLYISLAVFPLILTTRIAGNVRNVYAKINSPKVLGLEGVYPYRAVEFLSRLHGDFRIFNYFNWGGYMLWRLPSQKLFISDIMDTLSDGDTYFLSKYFEVLNGGINYQKILSKYNVNMIFLPPDTSLVQILQKDGSWKMVYQDNEAVIMIKGF